MFRGCRCLPLLLALCVSIATPAVADTYLVYSQAGLARGTNYAQWCLEGEANCQAAERVLCGTPEGGTFQEHSASWDGDGMGNDGYVGWGVFPSTDLDMTAFAGNLRFSVKLDPPTGNQNIKVEFECNPEPGTYPNGVSYATFITDHGWQPNTSWQDITVPLVDGSFSAFDIADPGNPVPIVRPLDNACLQTVQALSKFTLEGVDIGTIFATMSIDHIRWEMPNAHSGASSVTVQGRQLLVDGKPFVVNAVAYAPVGVGENWQDGWRDRADRYNVDFPLIAGMGANAVRLYAPLLTTAMLDKAAAEGLYVIPTFGVDSINLECAAGKTAMENQFVDLVNQWGDHPAILAWLIGNEVNLNLTPGANLCADWYPQLQSMALAAENAGSTLPVGTAVGGMGDVCTSCSDDVDLPNVDFWGVQLYLGCTYGSSFTDYAAKPNCARPLIVTEYGVDAYHRPGGAPGSEDQATQASCMDSALAEGHLELAVRTPGGVLAGQTLFEWSDEWWKAQCTPNGGWGQQDTCPDFDNPNFPDGKVHEEWFGIVSINAGDPNARSNRVVYDTTGDAWLGPVCNMQVDAFNAGTGEATISFSVAQGNLDPVAGHDLHYGPLSSVSTYGYTGSLDLGPTSPGVVTLPAGDLFWVVAGENSISEDGCHGLDSAGAERPCSTGNCVPGWSCSCSAP